jgi:hypothetical protein
MVYDDDDDDDIGLFGLLNRVFSVYKGLLEEATRTLHVIAQLATD